MSVRYISVPCETSAVLDPGKRDHFNSRIENRGPTDHSDIMPSRLYSRFCDSIIITEAGCAWFSLNLALQHIKTERKWLVCDFCFQPQPPTYQTRGGKQTWAIRGAISIFPSGSSHVRDVLALPSCLGMVYTSNWLTGCAFRAINCGPADKGKVSTKSIAISECCQLCPVKFSMAIPYYRDRIFQSQFIK